MPIIKPISDLRNKTNHISDLVHKSHEPVFITKNGGGRHGAHVAGQIRRDGTDVGAL